VRRRRIMGAAEELDVYLESESIPPPRESGVQLVFDMRRRPFCVYDPQGVLFDRFEDMGDARDLANELGVGAEVRKRDDNGGEVVLGKRVAPRNQDERIALEYLNGKFRWLR
jgi:hypothetical protein